ncbi:hypothetical protein CN376_22820 [Bacillus cereus]|uniref:hypothetical protein n=1 Tax=Bacillus cereus TaxID=1396 RepID=UPI000BFA3CCE|nr:hypothetical protein [Bacillus cereus]PEZ87916.1 hypothetical protein CN376_22820 [Bacillus cereus]PFR12634.1 hypothetical protein COK30_13890 [Bacillus cereus]
MFVYINRCSVFGEETKEPPTEYCKLTEQKYLNRKGDHCSSMWFIDISDLGSLIEGLADYEQKRIIYHRGVIGSYPKITIYD